ncbi:MAG: MBL fold metallo-hydrolase [Bacteroidetes bacterium]|nr:MBL fold metallo-hydrolase [Bacteroidota bacterium]
MALKKITEYLYQIPLGPVNAYLLMDGQDVILIDTGFKNDHLKIFKALNELNKKPSDIKHILLTHSHPDHAGALADLVNITGAKTYMHFEDAALIQQGLAGRLPHEVSPEILNKILYHLFIKRSANKNDKVQIDVELKDKDQLPFAGGLSVIYTPGHSLGHVCYYIPGMDLLIAGDICSNMMGLKHSTVYENTKVGIDSIKKVAALPFNIAVFGHGNAILNEANVALRNKFK